MGAPGKGARLPSRSHLPKNDLEQLSNNPCNKAGDDGQYQGGVSRIRQLVIYLTSRTASFPSLQIQKSRRDFRDQGFRICLQSIQTGKVAGRSGTNAIRSVFERRFRDALGRPSRLTLVLLTVPTDGAEWQRFVVPAPELPLRIPVAARSLRRLTIELALPEQFLTFQAGAETVCLSEHDADGSSVAGHTFWSEGQVEIIWKRHNFTSIDLPFGTLNCTACCVCTIDCSNPSFGVSDEQT